MEFYEKLQELRIQKGLTQEALAEALFVSRTAISKWESGRGYPNIESLKAIAKFFGVTIDQLLSGEELLTLAETDTKQREHHLRDLVFGLLDCSIAMFFFLPFFGQTVEGSLQEVSLVELREIAPYLRCAYFTHVIASILLGIATLSLQNCRKEFWTKSKGSISLVLSILGVLLFVMGTQPYAAAFLFVLLIIKVFMLMKRQ